MYNLLQENGSKLLLENGGSLLLEIVCPIIFINGVNRTNQVDWQSFQKTEVLTKDPDVLVLMFKNYPTKTYQPALNDLITVYFAGNKIFAGYVLSTDETIDGLLKYYTVTAKDYSEILDRIIVSSIYTNQTANYILNDLITSFCPALSVGQINCNIPIPLMKFNYISVRECVKKVLNVVGNYDYYVDYYARFFFLPVGITPAPFSITDTSQNYNWNSLEVQTDLSQLANVILVRGAKRTGTTQMTEYFSGDGTTYTFPLAYMYPSSPIVTVGATVQTVGNDGVTPDTAVQCQWNMSSQSIRFTAGNIPVAGTRNINVQGFPLYPLLIEKSDDSSIGTYGQWQKVIIDKNLQDQQTAGQRADAELLANAQPISTLNFSTYVNGLVKGQVLIFKSVVRNLNLNLSVQQIVSTLHTATKIMMYQVTAVSAPPVGLNEVLNQLLVKDPANQIDIDDGELLERYYNFSESASMTDSISNATFTSGPYVWDTMVWGFFTWG